MLSIWRTVTTTSWLSRRLCSHNRFSVVNKVRWLAHVYPLPQSEQEQKKQSSSSSRTTTSNASWSTVGLLSGLLLAAYTDRQRSETDLPSSEGKIVTVYCAQKVNSSPTSTSKERLSAIKSLDIVADVAEEAQPAVVSITSTDKGFLARNTQSTGSGFIIDDLGHVITNAHVVGYRTNVFVHLSDGRAFPGRVIALDVSSDLAILQLDVKEATAKSLPKLPLASNLKLVRPGHFVLALGSPLMLANSVTVGVVSALERDLGHSEGLKYIQTDAIITLGNSGGPLVDLYGQVIGVNSMIAGIGVGFAIPVDQVQRFVDVALSAVSKAGKAPPLTPRVGPHDGQYIITDTQSGQTADRPQQRYVGLIMRTLTPEMAFELASRGYPQFAEVTEGVLIHAIIRNSPAQKAGLRQGDVIIAIDGLPITNAQQVYAAAENREELSITVLRQGQRINFPHVCTEKV